MRPEVGKRYVRRDGKISGVITKSNNRFYTFFDPIHDVTYAKNGLLCSNAVYPEDLISEYITESVDSEFKSITDSIASLLEHKNKNYGNAALEPLNIFSGKCKAGHRLDDKLARIQNSDELRKNDTVDLIGYLILTCKEKGWTNFDEFKD